MQNIDVVILCGGKGTRLKSVIADRPKPMAEINGRPFLDILVEYASSFGLSRFILCTGYLGDAIEDYYTKHNNNLTFAFSREHQSLGTGGALKNAEPLIQSNPFLVMNGDSFCPAPLDELVVAHRRNKALVTLAVAEVDNAGDYGSISLDDRGKILSLGKGR